ncbi:glycosyltransferase family 4 protein [Halomonas sp. 328]|uniref:glycosyltransferase family 4 protein n=1 Tax=Halomonas sp. 328 TaxID=2776704 RepID=UPI0018A6D542|nr:glycosyltransferase family 4 protein [Halomonas sp. 328]MBF8223894.1 glycosyltransferase family 4 protein [Halomonas sp. 328]
MSWVRRLRRGLARRLRASLARAVLDDTWYLAHYADVAEAGMAARRHFLEHGANEGRSPNAWLSLEAYAWRHGPVAGSPWRALRHYRWLGRRCILPVEIEGARAGAKPRPCLMLCGHSLTSTPMGAERSLQDVARGLDQLGYDLVVTLPTLANPAYVRDLLGRVRCVVVLPYGWWHPQRTAPAATVAAFEAVLRRHRVRAVYLNTLTLESPALAARTLGLPVITHVRELPEHDPQLCFALGAPAGAIVAATASRSDLLIANSRHTGRAFADTGRPVAVVPNSLPMSDLVELPPPRRDPGAPLRVGLLGSLIAKKGLDDMLLLAAELLAQGVHAECLLYGPGSASLDELLAQQAEGRLPANLHYCGYVRHPREALAALDVVVNLSHFQESFGRTVLEAMAAARPVVAYAWGALPELVEEGVTGYLVPRGDIEGLARRLGRLATTPEHLIRLGEAGRRRALQHYGQEAFLASLQAVRQVI